MLSLFVSGWAREFTQGFYLYGYYRKIRSIPFNYGSAGNRVLSEARAITEKLACLRLIYSN